MKNLSLFAITLLASFSLASTSQAAPKVGAAAPEFTLKDSNGKEHSLSSFKGKFVVLEWLNHDCPFVKKHYESKNMQNLQKEFTGKDVVWLSICSSAEGKQGHMTPEQANQLTTEKAASPTAVLLDGDGGVGKLYDAKTTPQMFVIDPEGTLVYSGAIDDKKSADPADVASSKNYVSQALNEVLAKKAVSEPVTASYGCSVKY